MKIKIIYLAILGLVLVAVAGCCTTEERLVDLGESVHNIALDGDGIN